MKKQKDVIPVIDVPAIKKEIKTKHSSFIKKFGSTLDKVIADKRFCSYLAQTRLVRIAYCFKEEGIIDLIDVTDNPPCFKIKISKGGYDNYVEMITNGTSIVITGIDYSTALSPLSEFYKTRYDKVNETGFDWLILSRELLNIIHGVIYERREALNSSFIIG